MNIQVLITVLVVCGVVLVGFVVWENNNKREIEFQREKLEQEANIKAQEEVDKTLNEQRKKLKQAREQEEYRECLQIGGETLTSPTAQDIETLQSFCKDFTGYTGVVDF